MSKKVKTRWVVTVPEGAKIKVMAGEEIEADGDLLEFVESSEKIINVSERLAGLSSTERLELAEKLKGVAVNEGETVYKKKGIFSKNISLPINGVVMKIDEFGNLHYREPGEKTKKISCPVKAKVVKIDGKSLELEFRAVEYLGRGVNEGRVWATAGIGYVNNIADLSVEDGGKIILTEKPTAAWLTKAEVVGVKGVVIIDSVEREKDDRIDLKLPILALEKSEWEELRGNGDGVKRVMINAAGGRLLLVV